MSRGTRSARTSPTWSAILNEFRYRLLDTVGSEIGIITDARRLIREDE